MSFKSFFSGRNDVYVLFDGINYRTVKETLTKEQYQQHLDGEISLGVIPITPEGNCRFGVIDDDSHKSDKSKPVQAYDYNKLLKRIDLLGLPLTVYKSKSGGAHIKLLLDKHYPAYKVRKILKKMAYQLCDGTPEIFPKQDKLNPGETGSAINLPYHNGNTRVAIDDAGNALNPIDAMVYEGIRGCTMDELKPYNLLATKEMKEGRNNKLFSAASFLKKQFPDEWEDNIKKLNNTFDEPLPADELDRTVISSVTRKDYFDKPEIEDMPELKSFDVTAYRNLDIEKPDWISAKFIKEKSINFVFAEKGKGKTEFCIGFAFSVAHGLPFLNGKYNAEYAWPVQYVDGEMDAYDMIERTSPYIHAFGQPQKDFFQICNFSLQKDQTIPDIKDEVGQGLIQRMLERQEASTGKKPILFLDNLRSLSNYVENDSDSWRPIGVWLKNLRGLGYTIIVIDHTGKAAPGPRGTSSKTDWANVCIKIESDGKRGDKLMKCKISFDKARGLRPEDTAEYSCSYDFEGNWNLATSNKDLEDEEYIEQIKIITADGAKITQKAIADELGISVGKVNSLIKKIKAAPKKTGVFN